MKKPLVEIAKEKMIDGGEPPMLESYQRYHAGNSQLLMDYRESLVRAYGIGEKIKELYGIIPPKVITKSLWEDVYLSLVVN